MNKRLFLCKILIVIISFAIVLSDHVDLEKTIFSFFMGLSGYVLLCVSAFGRTWASAFISGKKNKSLVTGGPYSLVRNPLYLFSFLGFLGAGFAFESISITVALVVVFSVTHWPSIMSEEKKLGELFGVGFQVYKTKVPRFIPNFSKLTYPEQTIISPKVFTRALFESSLIMGVFLAARVVEWAHDHSLLVVLFRMY